MAPIEVLCDDVLYSLSLSIKKCLCDRYFFPSGGCKNFRGLKLLLGIFSHCLIHKHWPVDHFFLSTSLHNINVYFSFTQTSWKQSLFFMLLWSNRTKLCRIRTCMTLLFFSFYSRVSRIVQIERSDCRTSNVSYKLPFNCPWSSCTHFVSSFLNGSTMFVLVIIVVAIVEY
jgi:hypothetical protein